MQVNCLLLAVNENRILSASVPAWQVERHAVKGLLLLVERERRGETIDRQLLQSLLRMLGSLGTYPDAFQRPFLEESYSFYRVEGNALMAEVSVPEYLRLCEVREGQLRPARCTERPFYIHTRMDYCRNTQTRTLSRPPGVLPTADPFVRGVRPLRPLPRRRHAAAADPGG